MSVMDDDCLVFCWTNKMCMKVTRIPDRAAKRNLHVTVVWESSLSQDPLKPLLRSYVCSEHYIFLHEGQKITLDVSLSCLVGNVYRHVTIFPVITRLPGNVWHYASYIQCSCEMYSGINHEVTKMAHAVFRVFLTTKCSRIRNPFYCSFCEQAYQAQSFGNYSSYVLVVSDEVGVFQWSGLAIHMG